jgi:hypothetical protein
MGQLARSGDLSNANLRRAMVYGATMGSFAVSAFGIDAFKGLAPVNIEHRVRAFRELTSLEMPEPVA